MRSLVAFFALSLLGGCSGGAEDASPGGPATTAAPAATTASAAPVGRTAYARKLNALCARALAAHAKVGSAATSAELAQKLPRTNVIDHRFVRDVRKLEPSKAEVRRAGRLLYLYSAMVDIQDTAYVHLKATGPNGYFQYMSTAIQVRSNAEKLARNLGAAACAQRPVTR